LNWKISANEYSKEKRKKKREKKRYEREKDRRKNKRARTQEITQEKLFEKEDLSKRGRKDMEDEKTRTRRESGRHLSELKKKRKKNTEAQRRPHVERSLFVFVSVNAFISWKDLEEAFFAGLPRYASLLDGGEASPS
jgi:hypothetical protein